MADRAYWWAVRAYMNAFRVMALIAAFEVVRVFL